MQPRGVSVAYRNVVEVPASDLIQFIKDVSQLPSTSGIAASDLQIRKSLLDRRIENFEEVFCLISIREHAGIISRVEVGLIVSTQHRDGDVFFLSVETNMLDQIVCVCLPPVGCAIATTDSADEATVAFVLVAFHASRCTPGVGVDEQVWVVLESRLGQVDLTRIVAIPGVVERSGRGRWTRAKDRTLLRRLDEVPDNGQSTDVFVEKCLGDLLLVVVRKTGCAELIAWSR